MLQEPSDREPHLYGQIDNLQEIPTKLEGSEQLGGQDKWVGEENNLNIDNTERETHNRDIPQPHIEPENGNQMANVYVPSLLKKANQGIREQLNSISFQNSAMDRAGSQRNAPHEFSIKLDPEALNLAAEEDYAQSLANLRAKKLYSPSANAIYKQESPTYQGKDYYKNKISELEYALRQEMLKNEETQAMNYALKQVIEEFQHSKRGPRLSNPSLNSVRISDVVSNSGHKQTQKGAINSEKEMELKIEVLNLSEKLETQTSRNLKFQAQMEDLRQINEQANKDLKLAIESVKQAKEIEDQNQILIEKNKELQEKIDFLEAEKDASQVLDQSNLQLSKMQEEDLKKEFKVTIDKIKEKYEAVIKDLTMEKQKLTEQVKEKSFDISREFRKSSRQSGQYSQIVGNDYEFETRKELEKLLFQNSELRREKVEIQAKCDEYLEKIHKLNETIAKLKQSNEDEVSQKQFQIRELMSQLEDQETNQLSAIKSNPADESLQGEVQVLNREIEMIDQKLKKNNFLLRMVYSRVNYMLGRVTGRQYIDKINDNLLIMDLKSKIDTLSTELDTILSNKTYENRKRKENEKKVLELESQLEQKTNMYKELVQEFEVFEGKIIEFEEREQQHIDIIQNLKEDLDNVSMAPPTQIDDGQVQELQEKLVYLEDQVSLEKEEKMVYRNLMDKLIDGFDNQSIGTVAKELYNICIERVELKLEANKMKNKILEDEDRVDDSNNWKELVNELRYNLEEKTKREQSLNGQYDEAIGKLDKLIREEKRKTQKLKNKESELAELKIQLRRAKASAFNYGNRDPLVNTIGHMNSHRRPPSPIIKSSARLPRRSYQSQQGPQSNQRAASHGIKNQDIDKMLSDHHSSFSQIKSKLNGIKAKLNQPQNNQT